jgi:hypothetical protein
MSFFKTPRSAELDTSAESIGDIREFVRRDIAGLPRPPERDSEVVAAKLGSLLQRVIGASVQNIDDVILELQIFRERLDNESARMQREIVEYATMSQAAMQSTRIIAESLTSWKKAPDAESPSISA